MRSQAPESSNLASVVPASLREQIDFRKRLVDRVTRWKAGAGYTQLAQSVLRKKFNIDEIEQAYQVYEAQIRHAQHLIDDDEDERADPVDDFVQWLNNKDKSSNKIGKSNRTFKQAAADFAEFQVLCHDLGKKIKKPKDVLTPAEFESFKKQVAENLESNGMGAEINRFVDLLGDEDKFADYYFRQLEPAVQEHLEDMKRRTHKTEAEIREQILKNFNGQELTIRLVITDIEGYKAQFWHKMFARLFFNWGINHTALQIGPYLIDWNDGELVIPRPIRSRAAIARFRFQPLNMSTEDVIKKVSKICVDFNQHRTYSPFGTLFNNTSANCQSLVDSIINELGLQVSWSNDGPISHYLSAVRASKFSSPTDLMIWHGGDPPETRITSHPELRAFYLKYCVSQASSLSKGFLLELEMMVKSVERCFQMQVRHFKKQGDLEKVEKLWPNKEANPPIFRPANANPNPSDQSPLGDPLQSNSSFVNVPDYESEFTGDLNFTAAQYGSSFGASGSRIPNKSSGSTSNILSSGPTS